jgi:hypothetical protein
MPRCTQTDIRVAGNRFGPVVQGPMSVYSFSFRDDLIFDENGLAGPAVQREGLYSWAYVLQMTNCTRLNFVETMTVVMYRRRSQQFTQDGSPTGEALYTASFGLDANNNPNPRIATVRYTPGVQEMPSVRRGGWVADVTLSNPAFPPTDPRQIAQPNPWRPRANFYRVVNITEVDATTIELELQTEVKDTTINGTCAVLDNVVEVFEKGQLVQ